jgi:sugar-specific transcriptional regulator TrmB
MIQDDEYIQRLMDLGLTFLQAKIYINLAKLEKTEIKKISKASNVARTDIYRIMPTIEKLGLAEKIIANPTMYKATPIKEGLSLLLQNKKTEYAKLEKKTSALLNDFPENNLQDLQEENLQFMITSEKKLLAKMHKKQIRSAQTSIEMVISSLKVFRVMLFDHLENLKRATKKGVKIRAVIQKVEGESIPSKLKALTTNPFFELRCLSNPDLFGVIIFDRKEVTLCVCASRTDRVPSLWSNNPIIVKLAEVYFENMWNKAEIKQNNA